MGMKGIVSLAAVAALSACFLHAESGDSPAVEVVQTSDVKVTASVADDGFSGVAFGLVIGGVRQEPSVEAVKDESGVWSADVPVVPGTLVDVFARITAEGSAEDVFLETAEPIQTIAKVEVVWRGGEGDWDDPAMWSPSNPARAAGVTMPVYGCTVTFPRNADAVVRMPEGEFSNVYNLWLSDGHSVTFTRKAGVTGKVAIHALNGCEEPSFVSEKSSFVSFVVPKDGSLTLDGIEFDLTQISASNKISVDIGGGDLLIRNSSVMRLCANREWRSVVFRGAKNLVVDNHSTLELIDGSMLFLGGNSSMYVTNSTVRLNSSFYVDDTGSTTGNRTKILIAGRDSSVSVNGFLCSSAGVNGTDVIFSVPEDGYAQVPLKGTGNWIGFAVGLNNTIKSGDVSLITPITFGIDPQSPFFALKESRLEGIRLVDWTSGFWTVDHPYYGRNYGSDTYTAKIPANCFLADVVQTSVRRRNELVYDLTNGVNTRYGPTRILANLYSRSGGLTLVFR